MQKNVLGLKKYFSPTCLVLKTDYVICTSSFSLIKDNDGIDINYVWEPEVK